MTATTFPRATRATSAEAEHADTIAVSSRPRSRARVITIRWAAGLGIALGIVGVVLLTVGNYTHDMIRDQLVAQQITFPPADSPGMTAVEYPGLQQYAGQVVDDGPKARAWADQFMAPHILELSGGVPYGVFSAQAFMNPQDEQANATSKLMAIGEVQRGLLLSAWGWWTVGTVTRTIGLVMAVLGGVALVLAVIVRFRSPRTVIANM
jgi:hypothetical protein